jgi:hypothetical protein
MKRIVFLLISLATLLSLTIFASAALTNINPQHSKLLNSGNNVCEYYQNEFSVGEQDTITINGATMNLEYFGDKNWKINDYEGKLQNHQYFTSNQNSKIMGVRFDFSFMDQYQPEGNLGLTEQDYYPWDCQGFSKDRGLISEIRIQEGWNLIPFDVSLKDCYYALKGELCKDDILASYYYISTLNKYYTEKELEEEIDSNPVLNNYFNNNGLILQESSKWIYVLPSAGNKKVIGRFGSRIPYRNKYLGDGLFKLNSGWNFLIVDAFMVYDDDWQENPVSMDDIAGSCNVKKVYLWDILNHQWKQINGEFDNTMIGSGIVVKVTDDCTLGYGGSNIPPSLPN